MATKSIDDPLPPPVRRADPAPRGAPAGPSPRSAPSGQPTPQPGQPEAHSSIPPRPAPPPQLDATRRETVIEGDPNSPPKYKRPLPQPGDNDYVAGQPVDDEEADQVEQEQAAKYTAAKELAEENEERRRQRGEPDSPAKERTVEDDEHQDRSKETRPVDRRR